MSQSETVVVTGFGPFMQYLINPSWQAAQVPTVPPQDLKMLGLGEDLDVYIKELPVSYSKAQQLVSHIWETVRPKLAVHLGIAPGSKAITLEQTGKNDGYTDRDACGCCPHGNVCVEGGPDKLDSIVDMKSLTRRLKGMGLDVIYSRDAGRYVCDFVYYYSLHVGKRRAAFIHVPASGSLSSPERLVPLLHTVIMTMLRQLEASTDPDHNERPVEHFHAKCT